MPQTTSPARPDGFTLWYRITAPAVISLLHVVGPAQLDGRADPRREAEEDYLRRRNLHRQRLGKPTLSDNPFRRGSRIDPVIACVIMGCLSLVALLAWAILSKA